jgi:transcriptional regulator with XRE-family HTH domain
MITDATDYRYQLRQQRLVLGMTQGDVASGIRALTGNKTHNESVSLWETGNGHPRADTLTAWADVVHCRVAIVDQQERAIPPGSFTALQLAEALEGILEQLNYEPAAE